MNSCPLDLYFQSMPYLKLEVKECKHNKWFSYVMVNIVDHTHRKVNGKIHMPVIFTIIRIVKIE